MEGKACWYRKAPCGAWHAGVFQAWSVDNEDPEERGPGHFPVAIIMDSTTYEIRTPPATWINFGKDVPRAS